MALALDRSIAAFDQYLASKLGLANVWLALTADHGVAPLPETARSLRFPVEIAPDAQSRDELNRRINVRLRSKLPANVSALKFVSLVRWPTVFLDSTQFAKIGMDEADAEQMAADEFREQEHLPQAFTRWDLMHGNAPRNETGARYEHSYSSLGGWAVLGVQPLFSAGYTGGADHGSPYSYDTHVPLAFYGAAFRPGTYRGHAEPVDLVATLAALLGIQKPSHAVGHVLTEAIAERGNAASAGAAH
jgi:arylsulfatase A-like enzyme